MRHGDPITKSSYLGARGSREALTGHPAQVLRYRRLGEEAYLDSSRKNFLSIVATAR